MLNSSHTLILTTQFPLNLPYIIAENCADRCINVVAAAVQLPCNSTGHVPMTPDAVVMLISRAAMGSASLTATATTQTMTNAATKRHSV